MNTGTYLPCHGIYKKVDPNPKCWIYPLAHGSLNIEGAIENSCNCFFYEAGYRMSLKDNGLTSITSDNEEGKETRTYYSSEQGLDTLKKYAAMFGLGETSGLEIPESEPQISDDSSVPSAIGQGTNNYTTSQLARYITTVANKGNLFKLSLIDKVTTIDGEMVKDYTPEQENTLTEISSSTWTAVHNGMKKVISSAHPDMFAKLLASDVSLAGKTGTAQQSTTHPDHGLFVGFAPSESPEIAFAIRIANGYSSNYAAEVGRYVMEYYYGVTPTEEILTGHAAKITTSGGGD